MPLVSRFLISNRTKSLNNASDLPDGVYCSNDEPHNRAPTSHKYARDELDFPLDEGMDRYFCMSLGFLRLSNL